MQYFPDVTTPAEKRQLSDIFSNESRYALRDYVAANPGQIGQTVKLKVSLSDPSDQLEKGVIPRYVDALGEAEKSRFEFLINRGLIERRGADVGMKVNLFIDPQKVSTGDLAAGNFRDIIADGLRAMVNSPDFIERAFAILREDAADVLKAYVTANPASVGQVLENFKLPLLMPYATLASGETPKIFNQRFASEKQFEWLDRLKAQGLVTYPLRL